MSTLSESSSERLQSPGHSETHRASSIEDSFNEISLNEGPTSPSPFSPTPTRSVFLSPNRREFDDGDIGASVVSPAAPMASPPTDDVFRPRSRLLTRSPSPSPSRPSFSIQRRSSGRSSDGPLSPTRRSSSGNTHPQSPLSSPSRQSTTLAGSPPHLTSFKPALPSATIALNGNIQETDPTVPFESIPLQTTPPPQPVGVPLPTSPTVPAPNGKRSWGGSSRHSVAQSSTSSLHTPMSPQHEGEENAEAGPSTPSRLHAPPAHPHPFPVPSSSTPPTHAKRLSIASAASIPLPAQPNLPSAPALGVKGVSTFDKVRSHTRPAWLPPKDKIEDETHLHQWEEMMAQAREHEKERKRVAEIRRVEKEKRMAINTPRWEALLKGEFSAARIREDDGLRKLWFEGVPSHLRGKAWSLAVGNTLAMSKDVYKTYLSRAKRSLESGRFPRDVLEQIEHDMTDTLPSLKLYVPGSPMRDDLREFLCAWVVYRSDDGLGYAPYITDLAAMFLLSSPPSQAFLSLVNLLARPCLRAFYTQTTDEIEAYYRVFENLQADLFPKIYANCKNLGLKLPEEYFRSVFLKQVPFEACCRLWDQIMLDGDGYIFRSALAIFGFLEPRLYYPDKEEIESVLEGRNQATQVITEREKERAKLRGEAYGEDLDGKLSVFGLNEGALFDWLESDGWKESRFERLVRREMPD